MSYMKWIYAMVADNSYGIFKMMYQQAVEKNISKFMFQGSEIQTTYAKSVCDYVDKHCMPEYEQHLQDTVGGNESNEITS